MWARVRLGTGFGEDEGRGNGAHRQGAAGQVLVQARGSSRAVVCEGAGSWPHILAFRVHFLLDHTSTPRTMGTHMATTTPLEQVTPRQADEISLSLLGHGSLPG